jgi:hypothetical protein
MAEPIEPSRVIPPDWAPPTAAGAWEPPGPPPPPWWTAPPPAGPPAPLGPVQATELTLRIEYAPAPYEPPPEPRWNWGALWSGLATRGNILALIAALAPVFYGQSLATLWGHVLYLTRTQQSIGGAYVIAGTVTAAALWRVARAGRHGLRAPWLARLALVVTVFGLFSMARAYDPVTLITGVHP